MQNHLLHILNGDATAGGFNLSGLEGDTLIWREVLVDGPVRGKLLSADYWKQRQAFFERQFQCPPDEFHQKTISEFQQLDHLEPYTEIALWFEHDLFCQINMMAALTALYDRHKGAPNISLVCIGEHPDIPDFRGLGQLEPGHFPPLFVQRIKLDAAALAFAAQVWQAYSSSDPRALETLLDTPFPAEFPFLKAALQKHLTRFPSIQTGLSSIEQQLIALIADQPADRRQWVGKALREDQAFGFGDLQYFHRIDRLKALYHETEAGIQLSSKGKAVLAQQVNFLDLNQDLVWIGGAANRHWRWDAGNRRLQPV